MGASDLVHVDAINAACKDSGNTLGWRLLYSPASTLDGADIAFVGLNPGGKKDEPSHPRFAVPGGSAYVEESWNGAPPGRSPLQKQVRALFFHLAADPQDVLSGNLVPFRSPSWNALVNKRAALDFGIELWQQILTRAKPRLVVCMGRDVTKLLARLLAADPKTRVPVGWGNVAGTRADFSSGTLIGLPHLSRFPIIGRSKSEFGLRELFGKNWS